MKKQLTESIITSVSPEKTMSAGRQLATSMPKGGLVCLYGELGSGKTVFSKGFAMGLGIKPENVKSPTYTLQKTYVLSKGKLHHFDFYRIDGPDELMAHEMREIFAQEGDWIIIEWADRVRGILPEKRKDVHFEYGGEDIRKIKFS